MSKFSLSSKPAARPAFSLQPAPSYEQKPKYQMHFSLDAETQQTKKDSAPLYQRVEGGDVRSGESARYVEYQKAAEQPKPAEALKYENVVQKITRAQHEATFARQAVFEEEYRNNFALETPKNKPLSVIFSGHVDHGKSTISGHILANLQIVDYRQIEKYRYEASKLAGESWAYAYALDACEEERYKGKTVETARATFTTPNGRRVVLLDSPGHKGFIMSMIDSAAQADVGVLVTSARKGEYETGLDHGGYTAEHALILYISGVKNLIICVNKMDDCGYKKERFDEIRAGLLKYLTSIGFKAANIQFVPISGITGENLTQPLAVYFPNSKMNWYEGECLLNLIDQIKIPKRDIGGLARACISGKYKEQGGCVAVCKVEKGYLKKGESYISYPSFVPTKISLIEDEAGNYVEYAMAGENCRVYIDDAAFEYIFEGSVICDKQFPCETATRFVAKFMVIEHPAVLTAGFEGMLHVNTSVVQCTVEKLLGIIDPKTGKLAEKLPKFVKNGQQCLVLIEARTPICVSESTYESFLGRVLLRFESLTVGIGYVARVKYCDE